MMIIDKENIQARRDEKKKYLNQISDLKSEAEDILEEIQMLKLDEMFPSVQYTGMPSAHNKKDLSDYMAKLDEAEQKLIDTRYKKLKVYEKIKIEIEEISDNELRRLLTLRYIHCLSWPNVCKKMCWELSNIHLKHNKALDEFEIYEES